MSRAQKFGRLLEHFEKCAQSVMHRDEINSAVQRIKQVSGFESYVKYRLCFID
jgi:hypothetical protein